MTTRERIIEPVIARDGSVHYTSVTSPPDDSTAVCYMVPGRVIPVVFVPGVMGTNLMGQASQSTSVWLADTYAFYGDDEKHKAYGRVTWIQRTPLTLRGGNPTSPRFQ